MPELPASATGLAVALGCGLLIGLERERRKRARRGVRAAAGIRTFAIAALAGALAQVLAQPLLVALGAAAVVVLVAIAYRASRRPVRGDEGDPGLTTELALVVTYLLGVLAVPQPALAAAVAVAVAALLAARERLHRFATRLLSEAELHDALLLAALALVLLPLLPAVPQPALAGLVPRQLLALVLLILLLQAAGHVALRLVGARAGLALAGFFSGFVSSTATIASLGARARDEPQHALACRAGAMLSGAATWVQALLMLLALAPAAALAFAPAAALGLALTLATAAWQIRQLRRARPAASPGAGTVPAHGGPLRVREAALVAVLLAAVALAVGWAQRMFGAAGLLAGTALAALGDAHAPVAVLAALAAAGQVDAATVREGSALAIACNTLTRTATAFVAGGRSYGAAVALSLWPAVLAAGALAWALG